MKLRQTLQFLLYEWLDTEALCQRPRFGDHSRETFDAVLDTCERIARERYAPFNRLVDTQEPYVDGDTVVLPQATHDAHRAYVASGMLGAAQDYDVGGMQLPYTVNASANAFFALASVSIGSNLLTVGNANLLLVHGTENQKKVFAANEFSGRWAGTMCLSEPQAGSSLSDITTRAEPDGEGAQDDPLGPRYRLRGNKMWISSGDHELTENIVHLVLAKIPGPDGKLIPGTRGISLFIVPKKLVDTEGQLTGVRNDVALAGLNHKLGWRGTTNTLLNFGEGKYPVDGRAGAIGYLVGKPHEGLRCMFHMMNEARIGVGTAAVMLGLAGYYASLDYARNRPQGRPVGVGGKDAASAPVRIIEHADVKRMLLAQKSYCEGALALELYCARLVDEDHTGEAQAAADARLLLEVLTPIAKSWPSEWCLEANSLAIQIHGGYGYTRDFPVEQYWRDNRLNMIHEGTHGIHGLDLLGRKVRMEGGRAMELLAARIAATVARASAHAALSGPAAALQSAWSNITEATRAAWSDGDPGRALANAVPYMQAFGHGVLAWIWLDVATAALSRAAPADPDPATAGTMACMRYFYHYELGKIDAWLAPVRQRDTTCADMPEEAF
ncbi:MAG: acyl-CoA dehydrogenase [Rhodoferax sp.]|nr:acyl-CoA dehydrogenase [Rhodoferax sp.]MCP5260601.1 acyl-CoA dehydrogenase [Rhodoferax sp.]